MTPIEIECEFIRTRLATIRREAENVGRLAKETVVTDAIACARTLGTIGSNSRFIMMAEREIAELVRRVERLARESTRDDVAVLEVEE